MIIAHDESVGPVEHFFDHLVVYLAGISAVAALLFVLAVLIGKLLSRRSQEEIDPE